MRWAAVLSAAFSISLSFAVATFSAEEYGTPEEARAMLERAIAEVKANESAAIAKFNSPDGGFIDHDLYVFCFNSDDGKVTATAAKWLIGDDVRSIRDVNGKAIGQELYEKAKEGEIDIIDYMFPRTGSTIPVQKHSFFTKVGSQVCGVGYYEPPSGVRGRRR